MTTTRNSRRVRTRRADGPWWFLEVNPNGQWLWIEHATGLPIAAAVAAALRFTAPTVLPARLLVRNGVSCFAAQPVGAGKEFRGAAAGVGSEEDIDPGGSGCSTKG